MKGLGGAYPPKGEKPGDKRPPVEAKRVKPVGGWPTTVKTMRHGPEGTIAQNRRRLREERR